MNKSLLNICDHKIKKGMGKICSISQSMIIQQKIKNEKGKNPVFLKEQMKQASKEDRKMENIDVGLARVCF